MKEAGVFRKTLLAMKSSMDQTWWRRTTTTARGVAHILKRKHSSRNVFERLWSLRLTDVSQIGKRYGEGAICTKQIQGKRRSEEENNNMLRQKSIFSKEIIVKLSVENCSGTCYAFKCADL